MNWFTSTAPLWKNGYSFVRIFIGISLIYHGQEVFNTKQIEEYGKWLGDLHFPMPLFMAYAGKGSEFVGGILLALGLFTRGANLLLIFTFAGITFFMGHGKIMMEDQHPFLFIVLSLIYLFNGAGELSVDRYLLHKRKGS